MRRTGLIARVLRKRPCLVWVLMHLGPVALKPAQQLLQTFVGEQRQQQRDAVVILFHDQPCRFVPKQFTHARHGEDNMVHQLPLIVLQRALRQQDAESPRKGLQVLCRCKGFSKPRWIVVMVLLVRHLEFLVVHEQGTKVPCCASS